MRQRLILILILAMSPAITLAGPAGAQATLLGGESSLSFVSIKNVDVAEAHRFGRLEGQLETSGEFQVSIHLDSVDTQIPIRDERMREVLFQTGDHPLALATGQVDADLLSRLADGDSVSEEVPFTLALHGQQVELMASVRISRTGGVVEVVTLSPVLLHAAMVGLDGGIEKLREIAGLQSIGKAVPVYFLLRFARP